MKVDKEKLFESGVDMLIKVGKGKYFDTNSLSGGEKSLISLSLIFAIQEYKPYCFYTFDEIDAALDRRNSERLAGLLKRYMNQGQYIIITHNDSLITEAPVIFENNNIVYGDMAHDVGSPDLIVWRAVYYYITVILHHVEPCQFSVIKDDVFAVNNGIFSSPTGATQISHTLIVYIAPEDIITETTLSPTGFACKLQVKNHSSFGPLS